MSKINLNQAAMFFAITQLAAPVAKSMAESNGRDREQYFEAYVSACQLLLETMPEVLATIDADSIARQMIDGVGE